MTGESSIGPVDPNASIGDAADQATTEGVDAHEANEFDIQNGLAGAEAKPFAKPGESEAPDRDTASAPNGGLVKRPTGSPPQGGQQGAGADRP